VRCATQCLEVAGIEGNLHFLHEFFTVVDKGRRQFLQQLHVAVETVLLDQGACVLAEVTGAGAGGPVRQQPLAEENDDREDEGDE